MALYSIQHFPFHLKSGNTGHPGEEEFFKALNNFIFLGNACSIYKYVVKMQTLALESASYGIILCM